VIFIDFNREFLDNETKWCLACRNEGMETAEENKNDATNICPLPIDPELIMRRTNFFFAMTKY
jgi:hypothetical protein